MASKGQSALKEKKLILPSAFERTWVRSNATTIARMRRGRTHAQPALTICSSNASICVRTQASAFERKHLRSNARSQPSATAVIRGRTQGVRSNANNWCVRMQVPAFERTSVSCQPINRTSLYHLISYAWETLGTRFWCPLWPKTSPFFIVNTPKRQFNFMFYFTLN
jgi:hypothetical protein